MKIFFENPRRDSSTVRYALRCKVAAARSAPDAALRMSVCGGVGLHWGGHRRLPKQHRQWKRRPVLIRDAILHETALLQECDSHWASVAHDHLGVLANHNLERARTGAERRLPRRRWRWRMRTRGSALATPSPSPARSFRTTPPPVTTMRTRCVALQQRSCLKASTVIQLIPYLLGVVGKRALHE